MNKRYLRIVLRTMLCILWTPSLVMAAGVITLNQTLSEVSLLVLGTIGVLSTLSGATALVLRIDKELRDGAHKSLPRPFLFVSANMLGSWLGGALAFILGEAQNLDDWNELGLVIVASFMGARFIEFIAEKVMHKVSP